MPADDSPALLVARFLKANNYAEAYDVFVAEAGLSPDAGTISPGDLTLEQLLDEKRQFDISRNFEKLGVDDGERGWRKPFPEIGSEITTLPSKSNILSVLTETTESTHGGDSEVVLVSAADRQLHVLAASTHDLRSSLVGLQDSPILSSVVFRKRYLLTASMSGQLTVSDIDGHIQEKRRDHSKYIVQIATYDNETSLVATAGWDNKVVIYSPTFSNDSLALGAPTSTLSLPTKPESLILLPHPETNQPILLLSRTDSSFLYYYTTDPTPRLLGRQNLAPHSNAWVAFTPSSMALCPSDPSLLAVALSTVPHMKLLLVRLLIPPSDLPTEHQATAPPSLVRASWLDDTLVPETQASQARAALVVADREQAAIQVHCTTMAPQTPYSTPAVVWRPDSSGVWVNGDDGVIRGDSVTGEIAATLRGHDDGSKVRCLWAGWVGSGSERKEVLMSGGFDQKLIVWSTAA